ncbi:MAG: hypothetical protein KAU10_00525 [Dehalococcoidia bacterium]|nr:hypothetical protein [Dehalococcoidia bacterium]
MSKVTALVMGGIVAIAAVIAVVTTTGEPASTPATTPAVEWSEEEEDAIAAAAGDSSARTLTLEQKVVRDVAVRLEELPEGWFTYSRTWGIPCACMEDLACRTVEIDLCFQNDKYAGWKDRIQLLNTVYLCWAEETVESYVSGNLGEGVEGVTILEVDVGDEAYCQFHYDGENEVLQEADLLLRKGLFYARFRYWGAPLCEMSEAEVLAFLVPLAENVCGRIA